MILIGENSSFTLSILKRCKNLVYERNKLKKKLNWDK